MSLWTRHREECGMYTTHTEKNVVCILHISCSHCHVCLCGRDTEKNVVCILHISCSHCHACLIQTHISAHSLLNNWMMLFCLSFETLCTSIVVDVHIFRNGINFYGCAGKTDAQGCETVTYICHSCKGVSR